MYDGEPAFPFEYEGDGGQTIPHKGMSLRDWFAGQALSSIPNRSWDHLGKDENIVAAWATLAYAVADAMLLARSPQDRETPHG